jgi:DNA-binding PadR family transcriptional regulator
MSTGASAKQRHGQRIHSIRVGATLLDGPRTFEQIVERCYGYLRPLGLFKLTERQVHEQAAAVKERLQELQGRGWVVLQGERYELTASGRAEVNQRLAQFGATGSAIRRLLQPQNASRVTLIVHWALAALKLPAALLSGSVGLLNDAMDTLLDGFSSLLVYFGIRWHKERAVSVILVMAMLATGVATLYEAGRRFFVPVAPEADWFAFLAAVLSALVCLALGAYQRYVGLHSGMIALITQSVDSRNHVIVAASVTAGLVATQLRFPMLDTVVGLGVALLLLKSGIELTVETIRSLGEKEVDLSRFEFGIEAPFHSFLQAQLRDWILYLVDKQGVETRTELIARTTRALDLNDIPALRAMALSEGEPQDAEVVERTLADLVERGWLTGEERLSVTDAGRKRLERWM